MRVSTAVAILCLAAGVAPSVALPLPLPAFRFERAGGRLTVPASGRLRKEYTFTPIRPKLPGPRPGQPPIIIPPSSRHARPRPTFQPPPGFTSRPIRPILRPVQPQTIMRPQLDPAVRPPGSPPHQPATPPPLPKSPRVRPYSESPRISLSPYRTPSDIPSTPDSSSLHTPKHSFSPVLPEIPQSPVLEGFPMIEGSPWMNVAPPPDSPLIERELLEHIDQRIKLAARAYVRELLKASMDDLD